MRVLVAVLLLIGFGLLRVASVTGITAWAWVATVSSVAAVTALVVDWRRKLETVDDNGPEPEQAGADHSDATVVFRRVVEDTPSTEHTESTVDATVDEEVLVVDEHPWYHLPGCQSLHDRETIALTAQEAVALEFSPCEVCAPAPEPSGAASISQEPAHIG